MAWWIEAKIRKRTKAAVQVGPLVVHHVKCTQKWYIKMWNVFHILMGISKVFYAQILQLFWSHDGISCNIDFSYYANHYNIVSPFIFALFWSIYLRIKLILHYQIHAKKLHLTCSWRLVCSTFSSYLMHLCIIICIWNYKLTSRSLLF